MRGASLIGKIKSKLMDGEYVIAYRQVDGHEGSLLCQESGNFKILKANWRYWYADPIAFRLNDKTYVFMEIYDRVCDKGRIAVSVLGKKGELSKPQIILDEPFHMSFPLVFEYNNGVYMIPECCEENAIRIYKMESDVFHWKLYKCFNNIGKIVDASIYINEQILLLASQVYVNPLLNIGKAYILSDDLSQIHEVALDELEKEPSYKIRNGGPIIDCGKAMYQIKQVSTPNQYGKYVIINQIDEISTKHIKTRMLKNIYVENIETEKNRLPHILYDAHGIHTYGLVGELEVTDIYLTSYKISNYLRKKYKEVRSIQKKDVKYYK